MTLIFLTTEDKLIYFLKTKQILIQLNKQTSWADQSHTQDRKFKLFIFVDILVQANLNNSVQSFLVFSLIKLMRILQKDVCQAECYTGFHKVLISWSSMQVDTLVQRVEVLKLFETSKLWYKASALPLPCKYVKKFKSAIFRFFQIGKPTLCCL